MWVGLYRRDLPPAKKPVIPSVTRSRGTCNIPEHKPNCQRNQQRGGGKGSRTGGGGGFGDLGSGCEVSGYSEPRAYVSSCDWRSHNTSRFGSCLGRAGCRFAPKGSSLGPWSLCSHPALSFSFPHVLRGSKASLEGLEVTFPRGGPCVRYGSEASPQKVPQACVLAGAF